jgi:hypothetical protein
VSVISIGTTSPEGFASKEMPFALNELCLVVVGGGGEMVVVVVVVVVVLVVVFEVVVVVVVVVMVVEARLATQRNRFFPSQIRNKCRSVSPISKGSIGLCALLLKTCSTRHPRVTRAPALQVVINAPTQGGGTAGEELRWRKLMWWLF